jgi:hypothetical protein
MKYEEINTKIDILQTGNRTKPFRTEIPVAILVHEASDLFYWCSKDRDALTGAGLDWKLVEELPRLVQELNSLEAIWNSELRSRKSYLEEWKTALLSARKLRNKLKHNLYFAFYSMPVEYAKVKRMSADKTIAGLVQSLSDLATVGRKHLNELQMAGMDLTILDLAFKTAGELGSHYGRVNCLTREVSQNQELRNTAYLKVKVVVDEVRRVGKFVFLSDKDRCRGYASDYARMKKQKHLRKTDEV